jgi:transposase-like protein
MMKKGKRSRYSNKFKLELTRMHIEERMSYRVISKRLKEKYSLRISKNTICKIVNEIASYSKGDIMIKEEYKPQWEGYLSVDDKYFSVGGEKIMILIATDSSGDIIHNEVINPVEQNRIDDFFYFIDKRLNYPIKGITTDLDEMLEKSIKKQFSGKILHQKCLKHAMDTVDKILQLHQMKKEIERANKFTESIHSDYLRDFQEKERIYNLCQEAFYTSDRKLTLRIIDELRRQEEKYPKLIKFINRHLENLISHQKDTLIKKTNNISGNVNRRLMRRLKTIESFNSIQSAENYLNLYKNFLRLKPFTDCRGKNKYKNGKSPLEVCGVKLKTKDWLKNAVSFC